jgi:hypothetical protein
MIASTTASPNTDTSKEIEITNNSGVTVCVLCPTTNDPNNPADGVTVYDQALELLQATDGTTTVNNSQTKTFTLDQYYIDPTTKQETYATIYNLLVSTSNWLSPVANLGVMQLLSKFQPQTVTAASLKSMQEAAAFFQTISAYPNSKLATDFQTAMSSTQDAAGKAADGSPGSSDAVANSITDNVNNFFKSTTSYQDVTLASFVAVQSYYQAFPFVWAAYGTAIFYLYATTGSTTLFMGTLALTQPSNLDVALPNAGYSCVFTSAVDPSDTTSVAVDPTKTKNLVYLSGLFLDKDNPDNPSMAVKGLFMVKSQLTQNPSDTAIIPVLTGTVESMTALGFDQPQKSNDKNSAFWNLLFNPKGSAQVFQCIMTWGGAVMMLAFFGQTLYGIYKWARGLGAAKKPTMQDMFNEHLEKVQDALEAQNEKAAKSMSDGKMAAPADPKTAMEDLSVQTDNIAYEVNSSKLQDGINNNASSCQEMGAYEQEMNEGQLKQLESLGSQVNASQTSLNGATLKTQGTVVKEQTQALQDQHGQIEDFSESLSQSLSTESKTMITTNQNTVENINKELKESQEQQEKIGEEGDPKSDSLEFPE